MALVPTQQVTSPGLAASLTAAAAGDTLIPDDRTCLRVNNGSGAPITVTLTAAVSCSQGSLHNRVATVAAGALEDIPTGPAGQFADPTLGTCAATYSSVTSVTRAVVRN